MWHPHSHGLKIRAQRISFCIIPILQFNTFTILRIPFHFLCLTPQNRTSLYLSNTLQSTPSPLPNSAQLYVTRTLLTTPSTADPTLSSSLHFQSNTTPRLTFTIPNLAKHNFTSAFLNITQPKLHQPLPMLYSSFTTVPSHRTP